MPQYKVTYKGPFSETEKIIDADDLEDAEYLAEISSVYRYFTVEEMPYDEDAEYG